MINGFSKLTKKQKRQWIYQNYLFQYFPEEVFSIYDLSDDKLQKLHDDFIENTIGNYVLPLAVAPNFFIDDHCYTVPMVLEESSVVAAVSKAAKFWSQHGGFHCRVHSMEKVGHIHLFFDGNKQELFQFFSQIEPLLYKETQPLTENMRRRGGGISSIMLKDMTDSLEHYYQVFVTFLTGDAMGANFINSCLEQMTKTIERESIARLTKDSLEVLMSILSNYTPQCLVKAEVSTPVSQMSFEDIEGVTFATDFVRAIAIANADVYRAVTHNKGVMNGIDAVVIATGNDFRAVEAAAHAYATKDGRYKSLTQACIKDDIFHFSIEIPLAIGTIGGLTKLHPMVRTAMKILENPSAETLMKIIACVGLAQNFAAVSSLITHGIQKGHMKMHLANILNQLGATSEEKQQIITYFKNKTVSYSEVVQLFNQIKGRE
jgi:hydroxymethylglutaryl-CoA reductase, degradative